MIGGKRTRKNAYVSVKTNVSHIRIKIRQLVPVKTSHALRANHGKERNFLSNICILSQAKNVHYAAISIEEKKEVSFQHKFVYRHLYSA